MDTSEPTPATAADNAAEKAVHYEYRPDLVDILAQLGVSLLVSTYQAGKLVAIGVQRGELEVSFHNFDKCMGVAVKPGWMAVCAQRDVHILREQPDLAGRSPELAPYDTCYLTRFAYHTGDLQGHELAWCGDDLWFVNTGFSCLCTLSTEHSFVPRWKPPFISALAAGDRCHLNGFACDDKRPRYATMLGESDIAGGWRADKASAGCLIDVVENRVVARGFAMPHSPRLHDGRLWVLDSGRGALETVDPRTGARTVVTTVPGYTRGLAFAGPFAFVGLSMIRESSTFGGLPISAEKDDLRCGVAVVDLRSGQAVSKIEFKSEVHEIFDVAVIPGRLSPLIHGPHAATDGTPVIWSAPPLR